MRAVPGKPMARGQRLGDDPSSISATAGLPLQSPMILQALRSSLPLTVAIALGSASCALTSPQPTPARSAAPAEVQQAEVSQTASSAPPKEPEQPQVAEPVAAEPMEATAAPDVQEAEDAAQGFDQSHALWTEVLKQHVKGTNFNYGALKKDQASFQKYLTQLHAVTPAELKSWERNQRYAFWINVYNAHTIQLIVENYPLKSIRKLDTGLGLNSVFDKEFIEMQPHHPKGSDDKLSLNDVEHEILRERFKDARVHAAVNCASISCPPLLGEAFVALRLEKQLNSQMAAFINDSTRNEFDAKRGKVKASSIFKWFSGDFERDAGSVTEYLARFAAPDKQVLLKTAKLSYLDYDWGLNDAK